jgi:uncharacterized membrane protein
LHDDVAFAEFDRNPNFVPDNILLDVVARLGNYENCSPCRMDFVRDEIVDSLMKQQKIFYIKYYLFHGVITLVKFTIFKLKIININIYLFSYFITSI